jgi:hypothetical protein
MHTVNTQHTQSLITAIRVMNLTRVISGGKTADGRLAMALQ